MAALRRSLAAVLLALAMVAAACGDADDEGADADASSSETAPSTSAAETTPPTTEAPSSTEAPATTAAAEAETRVVDSFLGEIEIPVDPQRIIALDEYAAMSLLALGIEPLETIASYSSLVSQEILVDRGVTISEQADAFTINFEAIAASSPDVLVGNAEGAFLANMEPLDAIAPTVIVPYIEPWRDVISETGRLFDRQAESDRVVAAIETKIAEVAAVVEENPLTLSVLGDTFGIVFAVSPIAVLSSVIDEVGIGRPTAQAEGEPVEGIESVIALSTEVLGDHDADVVAVMSGVFYNAQTITDAPTYQALPGVQSGNDVIVDGDMWFGTHPFAIYWILEDLQALALGEGADGVGTLEDTQQRWSDYLALVG
ncbi:MAG: ABC transporter substrate-binding protein [Actinomycetota bacterium]